MLSKTIGLAGALVALATLLATPAAGERLGPQATAAEIVASISTVELDQTFRSPWQITWIPGGSTSGTIAFTDRGGNQVGLLDPTSLRVQNVRLNNITNPGPIAVLDNTRFAIAGTGGVGIFDRSGTGKVTELAMANTRNQALALGPNGNLFVADAQQHDLRIIRPPYSGPADITKFPLPPQCRNPTGLVPGATTIDVLCQQTNNIVRIDYTGNFGGGTLLPETNAGAQEARPSPTGFVFSGFNAGRFFSYTPSASNPFKSFALTGPAVPTVGLFYDPASDRKLRDAAARLRAGRKPTRAFFFNSFTPSFRTGSVSLGTFPGATSRAFNQLAGKNLVGSTNGPDGSIWVADATSGKPALHRISFGDGTKTGRTRTGYRLNERLTQVSPDFLARMAMPFFGSIPNEVRVGVTGASASPWNLKPTFSGNFGVTLTARGVLKGGGTYAVKSQNADTGAYTRTYRFFGFRPNTKSLALTFTGGSEIPASFKVDAVAEAPPCECDSLDIALQAIGYDAPHEATVSFRWELGCTGGRGACRGSFSIAGDKSTRGAGVYLQFTRTKESDWAEMTRSRDEIDVTCTGDCEQPQTKGSPDLTIRAPAGKVLGRDIQSVTVVVERTCRRVLAPKVFEIVFGANGVVDTRRSDLNGNGVRDGREKKK